MIRISKTAAFNLVAEALENNDEMTANSILQIITKSITKSSNKNKLFSPYIEIKDKRDVRIIRNIVSKYGKGIIVEKEQEKM